MGNEEETFRKLSRTPFKDLENKVENFLIYLIKNGWTYEEYCVEFVRILNKDKK